MVLTGYGLPRAVHLAGKVLAARTPWVKDRLGIFTALVFSGTHLPILLFLGDKRGVVFHALC